MADAAPPGTPAGKPRRHHLVILIGGGFVLMFGGCLLAIASDPNQIEYLFGAAFVIGGLMFMLGILVAIAKTVGAILHRLFPSRP
jgi:hypothetical protein